MMHLPYWLLKLLPMFDYICPRCKTKVDKSSHSCWFCGERYGIPLRVPPRVLKDPVYLEKYVHERVFPRISPAQRSYLSQYFTIIFSDYFEDGTTNAWTGTGTIVTSPIHHGNYAVKVAASNTLAKNFALTYDSIWARCYLRIDAIPVIGDVTIHVWLDDFNDVHDILIMELTNAAGVIKWGLAPHVNFDSTVVTWRTPPPAPQINQWYCVELHDVQGAGTGEGHLWIDGAEIITLTGLSNNESGTLHVQQIQLGMWPNTTSNYNTYFDCVVVADAYIGTEKPILATQMKWRSVGVPH